MLADLRGCGRARQSYRALALRKPNKLYCWDGLDCMEVVNMYKYLPSVIEHNLKESWKAEEQFNFLCTTKLAAEFSFPLQFSYPQMTFCFIPLLSPPPIFLPLSSLKSPRPVRVHMVLVSNGHAEFAPGRRM